MRAINNYFSVPESGAGISAKIRFAVTMLWTLTSPLIVFADESTFNSENSRWLAKFQSTYVWQAKPAFHADYSGPNSLRADAEKSYTFSATAYLGARLWKGAELYANPEVVQGVPLSGLIGLGGITNGEAQKVAGTNPKLYRARLFLRQTIELGGDQQTIEADFNQFAKSVDSRRIVITFGNFALNDIFDGNAYSHDPRTQFLNWTLMDYGAWDFAADARGFTEGLAIEFYDENWVGRAARAELPVESNGLALNSRIFYSYADNFELERSHNISGQPGKLRALVYRNVANMATYPAANALAAETGNPPDISLVRESRDKTGCGVSLEQSLSDSIGLFARYSAADGKGEEYAFAEVDRSVQMGLSIKGLMWLREDDTLGIAGVRNDLSSSHRHYLADGGLGFFVGDGQLTYHSEDIVEAYYSAKLIRGLWTTLDYQRITAPGYNLDRGPVSVYTARFHAEF